MGTPAGMRCSSPPPHHGAGSPVSVRSLRCSSLRPDLGHLDRRISSRGLSAVTLDSNYKTNGFYDEMLAAPGSPRPAYRRLYDQPTPPGPAELPRGHAP